MRNLKNNLTTSGKGSTNIQSKRTKGFGYQVLGFGSGVSGPTSIVATGGSPACGVESGDYKYHTFTGPGTFCVSSIAPTCAENVVSYMVIAGGGGGGSCMGGGGGAGGFREYKNSCDSYTASPLNGNPCGTAITVTATGYPITVGGAGGAGTGGSKDSTRGGNSVFSCITSAGGGAFNIDACNTGMPGGSAAGATHRGSGGTGNTPPTTPPQGNDGGGGNNGYAGAGGGGAGGAGTSSTPAGNPGSTGGPGGSGIATSITASSVTRAGGGGGGAFVADPGGAAGSGCAGAGAPTSGTGGAASANTGSGGGGGTFIHNPAPGTGGAGGSGIVVIRYKFQ
jgi:hypothetical protein